MKLSVFNSYKELSVAACKELIRLGSECTAPLVCAASGDTPRGLYAELVTTFKTGKEGVPNWNFIGLDEWVGMNGSDEGSCRHSLDQQLFLPLKIHSDKIQFFNGRAQELEKECKSADEFIASNGRIDIAILGLGMNGHIGFNEPGVDAGLRSHIITLDETTKKVSQKYFSESVIFERGITLGLQSLLESKHLILLVSGSNKSDILKRVLEGERTNQVPATLLLEHSNLQVLCDAAAAASLV